MPSRLGHGLYKKIDRLKNIFRCIYITRDRMQTFCYIAGVRCLLSRAPLYCITAKSIFSPRLSFSRLLFVHERSWTIVFVCEFVTSNYYTDDGIDEVDAERNSSDSETSSCSPEQASVVYEPEEPHLSSREESIMEEENIHQQGTTIADSPIKTALYYRVSKIIFMPTYM